MKAPTDWNAYGTCTRQRCNAERGQPCLDLRNWPLHYADTRRVLAQRPHAERPKLNRPTI